jgi:hypothetical protein
MAANRFTKGHELLLAVALMAFGTIPFQGTVKVAIWSVACLMLIHLAYRYFYDAADPRKAWVASVATFLIEGVLVWGPIKATLFPPPTLSPIQPTMTVLVMPILALKSSAKGCAFYEFSAKETGAIDRAQFTLQLPEKITSYKVAAGHHDLSNGTDLALFAASRGCLIVDEHAYSHPPWFRYSLTGDNMLSVDIDELPPERTVVGIIAQASIGTSPFYYDGTFQYEENGTTVQRPITFDILPFKATI